MWNQSNNTEIERIGEKRLESPPIDLMKLREKSEEQDKDNAIFYAWYVLGKCVTFFNQVAENNAKAIGSLATVQNELIKKEAAVQVSLIPDWVLHQSNHDDYIFFCIPNGSHKTNTGFHQQTKLQMILTETATIDAKRNYMSNEISSLQTKNQGNQSTESTVAAASQTSMQMGTSLAHMLTQLTDAIAKKMG